MHMTSETQKAQRELEFFRKFVEISKLPINIASVEKRLPPEPDLLCQVSSGEGQVAFELVELCDSNLASAIANPDPSGAQYIRTTDPSAAILRRKLRRMYETSHPIELLCYTNGRIITPPDMIVLNLKLYLGSFRHAFRRAWLLAEAKVEVLWEETRKP
jgi:hypothetical protein